MIGLPVQATATAYPPGFFCVYFLLTRNARKVQETMPRRKKRKTNRKKQPPKKKKSTARSRARDKKLEQLTVGAIWRVSTSDTVTTSTGKEKLSGWQNCRILSVTTGTCRSVQDRRLLAREKSRLDNLKAARSKLAEIKGKDTTTLVDVESELQTNDIRPEKPKLSTCRILQTKTRFHQPRKCVAQLEGSAYKEVGIPRGKSGGETSQMRSTKARFESIQRLKSNRQKHRDKNKKMKLLSKAATVIRQRER